MPTSAPDPAGELPRSTLFAVSAGTAFEWYDFYLFGLLAPQLAIHFFGSLSPMASGTAVLLVFSVGFLARPVGALLFGSVGDRFGRKASIPITILVMGLSTAGIAALPDSQNWGITAPLLLVLLRIYQGLAIGGEYSGALTYVAECAPPHQRGAFTAHVQLTASLGLLLALGVVLGTRHILGEAEFAAWGWRVPFAASVPLLFVSVWVRLRILESPAFSRLRRTGQLSDAPVGELFSSRSSRRDLLVAIGGLCAGQAVVWYAAHYYPLIFLQEALGLDSAQAMILVATANLVVLPLFLVFGALSDIVGRRRVLLSGMLLAAVALVPLFQLLASTARPDLQTARRTAPVTLHVDAAECTLLRTPWMPPAAQGSCDAARETLLHRRVAFDRHDALPGTPTLLVIDRPSGPVTLTGAELQGGSLDAALSDAGYQMKPASTLQTGSNRWWGCVGVLVMLGCLAAMVYGPLAATLAEMFPTRMRYTGTGLAYHVGNGFFGGLLPPVSFFLVTQLGSFFAGLLYPVTVAFLAFCVALRWLPETKDRAIQL